MTMLGVFLKVLFFPFFGPQKSNVPHPTGSENKGGGGQTPYVRIP